MYFITLRYSVKYIVVWLIAYLSLLLLCENKFNSLDSVIISSVITLIVCIYDNISVMLHHDDPTRLMFNKHWNPIQEQFKPMQSDVATDDAHSVSEKEQPNNKQINDKEQPSESGPDTKEQPSESSPDTKEQSNESKSDAKEQPKKEVDKHVDENPAKCRQLEIYEQILDPRKYAGSENLDQIGTANGKTRNELLTNHLVYSDFNRLPPNSTQNNFEFGYSFLPPKDWFPLPLYPPVCVASNPNPVVPFYADRDTMDLKDWWETSKITPPDSINTTFIANELNSKR